MKAPNTFLIGAAKSGTTTLAYWMSQHSEIYVPPSKETHFFTDEEYYSQGTFALLSTDYQKVQDEAIILDATPAYFHQPERVIPRLRDSFGDPGKHKYLLILRDPAARAYSHYLHKHRLGDESRTFEQAIDDEINQKSGIDPDKNWAAYVKDGLYNQLLHVWQTHIPKENFMIILQDDLISDPLHMMSELCHFLGLRDESQSITYEKKNEAREAKYATLSRVVRKDSIIKTMVKTILPYKAQRATYRLILQKNTKKMQSKPKISEAARLKLISYYSNEIHALEKRIERNLEHWRNQ